MALQEHRPMLATAMAAVVLPDEGLERESDDCTPAHRGNSLILHIAHDGALGYRARMFDERKQVGNATHHPHIDDAIRWYGRHAPVTGVQAFRIWYGGWCAGTYSLAQMEQTADDIAERLLVLAVVAR
jgi:hypothetical protein